MACSSLQTVSSSRMRWKYDVFVSFRGEDTRNNFTDHLFGALHKKGLVVFRDDTRIKKGEHISVELLQAIEASRVLIVIFSTNYASSTWCLKELAKIDDCILQVSGQTVLPIFYDVSPSDVGKQSGDYDKSFREHEERFKADLKEVHRWRRALAHVSKISGWDLRDKPQYAEIGKIIKEVTCLLGNKSSNLPTGIVGMTSQMEELENLMILDSDDDDDVRVLGICGMGGIGKTTLATALYARISNQFDACCFIDDVSKLYGDHGPIGVQKQLLCQTLNEENLQICNQSMASNLIRTRLCQMKSLVVLDNVDEVEQLDKLDMNREWLGTGSRIIIISRNEHILREHGVDEVYRVRILNRKYALQLFCKKAFKSDDIMSGYIYLTYEVLAYANGLPLAIKVLGSFLHGRDVSEWRSALSRLRESPRKDIMNVLRISFDGLEETEKDIFLDIACFFYRNSETRLKKILDFRGFHPEIGLKVLIDKSFITSEKQIICMHDLFRELGKSIVREKSPKEPRKWDRLWDYKDVHNVISKNMATENLEALVMQDDPENDIEVQKMATLRAEALAQMSRLKLLKLLMFNFSGSLNFLSSELGYLCWDRYPFSSLPSGFQPYKLVELVLQHSNIKKLWEGTKCLPNLTHIDLSHSKNLIMMPSFEEIPNLESLDLEGCTKLVKVDPSVGTLRSLARLNLKNCSNLVSIPNNIFSLNSLKLLIISGCPNLFNNLLEIQSQIAHPEMLDKKESTTQYQPTSFIYKFLKPHFRYLIFRKPEVSVGLLLPSLSGLSCLQFLDLSFCNLLQIPKAIGSLHCSETLYLGGNSFVTLPSSIKELFKLRRLNLQHCKQLKYLPQLPSKNILPIRGTTTYFSNDAEFNIFDCPSLIEMECCYGMVFSWMVQLLQVHMQSDIPMEQITIVIPKTQIPKWFNKQNVGSSISIDPSPIMHDKNLIGVACCLTFVAHDNPTNLGEEQPYICFGFQSKQHGRGIYSNILIRLGKDLVTVGFDHLLLIFFSREEFIGMISDITEELHDTSGIELTASVEQPLGLHLEVKNCGYRWIFKEDLEQLNPEMMYSGNSSIQPYY